jgi:hypothetical protein
MHVLLGSAVAYVPLLRRTHNAQDVGTAPPDCCLGLKEADRPKEMDRPCAQITCRLDRKSLQIH